MRIIFFGTSGFAANILSFLLNHPFKHSLFNLIAVVTQPDRPKGRNLHSCFSPVKAIAMNTISPNDILQPEKISTPEYAVILKKYAPDLFLVVAYGEIIKKNLLEIPRLGCFNIHASLLPKYRGAAPIQRCLMNGEKSTGINIIEMTPQMDAGDVILSSSIPISEEVTFGELEKSLCDLACHLTGKFLEQLDEGKWTKTKQDPTQVTFAPKLTPEDAKIDWHRPASVLHNLIRALSPYPGAWCPIALGKEIKRLKIKRARWLNLEHNCHPGSFLKSEKNEWIIACGEGALQLLEVQLEGKKSLSITDFLQGIRQPISFIY